jgi:type III secretory pathway component EscT
MPQPSLVAEIVRAFDAMGVDLGALGLAWARVTPTVALVPAFGLRALPAPVRGVMGLSLAACLFPALVPAARASETGTPWVVLALGEVVRGLPIALASSVPLWAATMAGGVVDALRGAQDAPPSPAVEGRPTPLGVPMSLLASAIFLATGGPARALAALATRAMPEAPIVAAAHDLVGGISLAVAIAGPLVAASLVLEIAAALVARAASPAQIHALLAPLRTFGILTVLGIVLERAANVMAGAIQTAP